MHQQHIEIGNIIQIPKAVAKKSIKKTSLSRRMNTVPKFNFKETHNNNLRMANVKTRIEIYNNIRTQII